MPEWAQKAVKSGLSGLTAFLLGFSDREAAAGVWSTGEVPVEVEGENYLVTLTIRKAD